MQVREQNPKFIIQYPFQNFYSVKAGFSYNTTWYLKRGKSLLDIEFWGQGGQLPPLILENYVVNHQIM